MNVIHILCDTFRRDHCGAYHNGRPLNEVTSPEQPSWVVPTPNLDRLAERGCVFDRCYSGSTPCMPTRRDIYTGRYEFPFRGWGPLEEDDLDLPGRVSPRHTKSIGTYAPGETVSYFLGDHKNMWCAGSGNYHFGFTGFEFIRGQLADPWRTDHAEFYCPTRDRKSKLERYWRSKHFAGAREEDMPVARLFTAAAEWLGGNHKHDNFFLQIDSFDPHEPWDPPEEILKEFDPRGCYTDDWSGHAPYAPWRGKMSEDELVSFQARYAGKVVLTDRWLGRLFDAMDRLDLWKNTMVIFGTDHGTFNGDHGRTGKMQTHEHGAKSHTPFIVYHPELARGERRSQLVQNVDIYPTVIAALGHEVPPDRHGVDLAPVLADEGAKTRDYAIAGQFGQSFTITDGRWILHQAPDAERPLFWYGYCLSKFYGIELGPHEGGRRKVLNNKVWQPCAETWLSDLKKDPSELSNLAESEPGKLAEMQRALRDTLARIGAPAELPERFGVA